MEPGVSHAWEPWKVALMASLQPFPRNDTTCHRTPQYLTPQSFYLRGVNMIWLSAIVLGLAAALVKLGAVSVWMSVFSAALKCAVLVIACLVVALMWKSFIAEKR